MNSDFGEKNDELLEKKKRKKKNFQRKIAPMQWRQQTLKFKLTYQARTLIWIRLVRTEHEFKFKLAQFELTLQVNLDFKQIFYEDTKIPSR